MKVIGVIPARFESSRFPGKPLVEIAGISMIERVYNQAIQSKVLTTLVVATDNENIYDHVNSFGGNVVMTSKFCQNGTERCVEVVSHSEEDYDALINIQGDEPILNPDQIDQLIELLNKSAEIATLAHELLDAEKNNQNIVKVAFDKKGIATGFSRDYDFILNQSSNVYKHVGLYGFKTSILTKIVKLNPTPNETLERLEQLRWLDHGYKIKVGITNHQNYSVDVPNDIDKILNVINTKT